MSEELIKRLAIFVDHFKFADDSKRGEAMSLLTELAADQVNTDTVSVPREPTKQMLDAGGNAHWEADKNGNMLRTEAAHRIYNAMLRAAQEGKK